MSSAGQSKLTESSEYGTQPRIFRFSVDADGAFTYEPNQSEDPTIPPTTWAYNYESDIEFRCPKGPFTVRQIRMTSAREGLKDPWGGAVKAVQEGDVWVAKPTIDDGLNEEERKLLWKTQRFVTKNRYVFAVLNDDKTILLDDAQVGIQSC